MLIFKPILREGETFYRAVLCNSKTKTRNPGGLKNSNHAKYQESRLPQILRA